MQGHLKATVFAQWRGESSASEHVKHLTKRVESTEVLYFNGFTVRFFLSPFSNI